MIINGTDIAIRDSLVVNGDLDLRGTGVIELPVGLVVGGELDVRGTKIKKLHKSLRVGGDVFF